MIYTSSQRFGWKIVFVSQIGVVFILFVDIILQMDICRQGQEAIGFISLVV